MRALRILLLVCGVLVLGGFADARADGVIKRKTSTRTTIRFTQGHKIKTTLKTLVVTHRFSGPNPWQDTLKIVTTQRRIVEHTYPDGQTLRSVQKRTFTKTVIVKAKPRKRVKPRTTNLFGARTPPKVRWRQPSRRVLPTVVRRDGKKLRPAPLAPSPPRAVVTKVAVQSQWRLALYQRWDWKTFRRWKPAQKTLAWGKLDLPLLQAAVFYETNRQRARAGRPPLRFSSLLEEAAVGHSRDMVRLGFFSHKSPLRRKETPSDRLQLLRPVRWGVGENIAVSFALRYRSGTRVGKRNGRLISPSTGKPLPPHTYLSAATAVVRQWMGSPGHRDNLLSRNYRFLGVGVAPFQRGLFPSLKWTQMFGQPY